MPTAFEAEAEVEVDAETATETATEPATEPAGETFETQDVGEAAPVAATNGGPVPTAGHRPGSLPTWWTDAYPQVSDVNAATAYLDRIGGAMSRQQQDGRWVLTTGAQVLFEADTPEELDGFVLGFALSQLIAERHGPISQARRS